MDSVRAQIENLKAVRGPEETLDDFRRRQHGYSQAIADVLARLPPEGETEQESYGNMRCGCGHLSSRHAVDYEQSDFGCFDCECESYYRPKVAASQPAETRWQPSKDGRYFIPIPGKAPCPTCQQPEGVQLHVSMGGYSVTIGFEHKPECPALRCPHGVLWAEDCAVCDMARVEEGYDAPPTEKGEST